MKVIPLAPSRWCHFLLNLFLDPTTLVTKQLGSIMPTDIFGINLMHQSWALRLADDLSTSHKGCIVLVNVGVIVVFDSAQQPGIAKWHCCSLGKSGLLDMS